MKKAKLLFVWLLCANSISSQAQITEMEYRSFAEEGKKWETQEGGIKENVYSHFIEGDTIIAGESWKKVYNSYSFSRKSYYAAVREVGKKIYVVAKGSNRSRLLYDFSLRVGDRVKCGIEGNNFCCLLENGEKNDSLLGFPFGAYLRVERIDTIQYYYNGLSFRRFTLTALDAYQEEFLNDDGAISNNIIWVEGVGSGAGPFYPWMPLPSLRFSRQNSYIGKQVLFSSKGFWQGSDYPNTVRSDHSTTKKNSAVYDLDGRKLPQAPQKGIFIQNGRKVAVK